MYYGRRNTGRSYDNCLFIFVLAAIFLAVGILTGCGGGAPTPTPNPAPSQGENSGAVADELPAGSFSVQGSDTMVNMGQHLAEVYMDNVNSNAAISVTGGGSGTGIAALINDNIDIAQVSRTMRDSEFEEAQANGVEAYEIIVAQDGLAIYLNEENPIDELDVAQLKDIFTGKITEWSELGWADGGHIDIFSRQSNSGTYVYINENIMHGEDWAAGTRFQPGSSQVVEGVKADRGGIGYSGIGYLTDGVKAINVGHVGQPAVSPREASNVSDGSYPISRPLFFYLNGYPEGLIRHYIDWVLSDEGQAAVVEAGFYGIHDEYRQMNATVLGN